MAAPSHCAGGEFRAGKWVKEARKRLSLVGEEEFLGRLDEWFTFPSDGNYPERRRKRMLRLLVWYGSLVDANRSLPCADHSSGQFEAELHKMCRERSDRSSASRGRRPGIACIRPIQLCTAVNNTWELADPPKVKLNGTKSLLGIFGTTTLIW